MSEDAFILLFSTYTNALMAISVHSAKNAQES